MPRTPEGRRVRSMTLSIASPSQAGGSDGYINQPFIVADDIRVIGAELIAEALISDAMTNADASLQVIAEMSRAPIASQPGSIIRVDVQTIWNGVICVASPTRAQEFVMFPEGYGMDFDEGEFINIGVGYESNSGEVSRAFATGIIYYVER